MARSAPSKRADRTPDGQQDGSTTRRRAGLDVAASAAAVRSEAEDERRSREQSVRAHHISMTYVGHFLTTVLLKGICAIQVPHNAADIIFPASFHFRYYLRKSAAFGPNTFITSSFNRAFRDG